MTQALVSTTCPQETLLFGEALGRLLMQRPCSLVLLSGPLGAGKTTLVQGIASALGVSHPITSPTFVTSLAYQGRVPLYHIDAWRVAEDPYFAEEVTEIFEQPGICVVEWPEQLTDWLPEEYLHISLDYDFAKDEMSRQLVVREKGSDYSNIVEELGQA